MAFTGEPVMRIQYLVAFIALGGGCKVDEGALPHDRPCDAIEANPSANGSLTYVPSTLRERTSTTTTALAYVAEPGTIAIKAPTEIDVRMQNPGHVGHFDLADLDAYACEAMYEGTCTPLLGTLDVDSFDASCETPHESCTRLTARLVIDPPADVADGPSVFGSVAIAEIRKHEIETCEEPARAPSAGCDCHTSGSGPGQL